MKKEAFSKMVILTSLNIVEYNLYEQMNQFEIELKNSNKLH